MRAAYFNGSACSYTSNTPQSTSARLGGGGIGQGMEKWLHFVVCIFLEFQPAVFFNSLTAIDGHDRQYFNELRSTVVSRQIFIRSQSLIAR
jgi:hypothetical protein